MTTIFFQNFVQGFELNKHMRHRLAQRGCLCFVQDGLHVAGLSTGVCMAVNKADENSKSEPER